MKVPAADVGRDLAQSLISRAQDTVGQSRDHAEQFGVDPARYILEKVLIEIWATEFGVSSAVGMRSVYRREVLDAFYETLGTLGSQTGWDDLLDDAAVRGEAYSAAYNSPHADPQLGSAWSIGKRFALHCNAEMSPPLIMVGAKLSDSVAKNTSQFVAAWLERFS